jgi:hypothetical protein
VLADVKKLSSVGLPQDHNAGVITGRCRWFLVISGQRYFARSFAEDEKMAISEAAAAEP